MTETQTKPTPLPSAIFHCAACLGNLEHGQRLIVVSVNDSLKLMHQACSDSLILQAREGVV